MSISFLISPPSAPPSLCEGLKELCVWELNCALYSAEEKWENSGDVICCDNSYDHQNSFQADPNYSPKVCDEELGKWG